MDSGEISAAVAMLGMLLSALGITGVDSTVLTGAINGLVSLVAVGAAVWSFYSHRVKSNQIAAKA